MAGMEQLEVHSKSYLIRWVEASVGSTISWSLQPHKKSINFGVFKHPGGNPNKPLPSSSYSSSGDKSPFLTPMTSNTGQTGNTLSPNLDGSKDTHAARHRHSSVASLTKDEVATAPGAILAENFQKIGLKPVAWMGRCEADRVSMGEYAVQEEGSGMYALVFDNTQSKAQSKTVTFVLMTYPTNVPPKSLAQIVNVAQTGPRSRSETGAKSRLSPALKPMSDSTESLPQDSPAYKLEVNDAKSNPDKDPRLDALITTDSAFYTGVLSKKRRKRNQGYARRFFSLDFNSSTLSYYKSRNSSALRGAIPLSLAAVGAEEKSRTISVDSGAEVWILKASNDKDFKGWRAALERASESASRKFSPMSPQNKTLPLSLLQFDSPSDREWSQAESLVGRVVGITDAMRRLAKDTDPKNPANTEGLGIANGSHADGLSPIDIPHSPDYFPGQEKTSRFWKRKSTSGPVPSLARSPSSSRGASDRLAVPSPTAEVAPATKIGGPKHASEHVHEHCMAVLRDLESVVSEFSNLIMQARQRRNPPRSDLPLSRRSTDTTATAQEFFDAEDRPERMSQLLDIRHDADSDNEDREEGNDRDDSASSSDDEKTEPASIARHGDDTLFVAGSPKSLYPLPHTRVDRRSTIGPSSGPPPSLISFLRKNVGKDLSTIAMPVTSNEPLSLLQRQAEQLEYTRLLDAACKAPLETGERILYIAAFAVSALSTSRSKERAIRKPFNPMLGETYELVREDLGYRFLAEKISHRPVRIACQAEHKNWSYLHSPLPTQKFWGKSAELITEGRVRLRLNGTGERYSWAPATCFLRNIIAGEKYVEPVQTMTIVQETDDRNGAGQGMKAVVTFKAGGMFSGRNEDLTVQAYSESGEQLPLSLAGKWTTSLAFGPGSHPSAGKEVWNADELVKDPVHHYGFTTFGAQLNEVTAIEAGALPPTDSRCRPDQRDYEEGDVDSAEALKLKLEEAQRRRRKEMETAGSTWTPRWFEEAGKDGEETIWRMKTGSGESYWDVRQAAAASTGGGEAGEKGSKKQWDGVLDVFDLS